MKCLVILNLFGWIAILSMASNAAMNQSGTVPNPPTKIKVETKSLYDGRNQYWYVISTRSLVLANQDEKREIPTELPVDAVKFESSKDHTSHRLEFIVKNLKGNPIQTSVTLYYLGAGRGVARRAASTDRQGRCIFADSRLECLPPDASQNVWLEPCMFSLGYETSRRSAGVIHIAVIPNQDYKMDMGSFALPNGTFQITVNVRGLAKPTALPPK